MKLRKSSIIFVHIALLAALALAQDPQDNPDDTEAEVETEEAIILDPTEAGEPDIYKGLYLENSVGVGTLYVLISALVGMVCCLFKNCSTCPNLIVCIGFMLPIIVYWICRMIPVESLDSDEE